ncbi:MAG: GAF domain-containing protein [Anaerolineae bacterium]
MTAASESTPLGVPLKRDRQDHPNPLASYEHRIGLGIGIALLIGAVVVALIYLVYAVQFRSTPFMGAMVAKSLIVDASAPLAGDTWTGLDAGLARRDLITSINGQPITTTSDLHQAIASASVEESITVGFQRPVLNGQVASGGQVACQPANASDAYASCTVVVPLMTFPDGDFLGFFVIPFISGLITIGIGAATFMLRPLQPASRLVSAVCVLIGIFMLGLFDLDTTHALNTGWMVATISFAGALMAFVLIFPVKASFLYRTSLLRYIPIAISFVLAGIFVYLYVNPSSPETVLVIQQLAVLVAMVSAGITVIVMLDRRRKAATAVVRDQSNTVLIGFLLSLILAVLWLMNSVTQLALGTNAVPLNTSAAMPFLVLPCLSLSYAVLQYRAVDTDRRLSQGITYSVMLFALIIGYFLLVLSVSLITGRTINAADPVLIALVIFIVAVLFLPVRSALQRRIDRVYFRQRVNFTQRLESFSQQISTLVGVSEILRAYRQQLDEALLPSTLFVFLPDSQVDGYTTSWDSQSSTDIRFAPDSLMIPFLRDRDDVVVLSAGQQWPPALLPEKPRLQILRTMVVASLRGSERLNGFSAIGAPRSRSGSYTYDELRFIQNLTTQIGVAVERALVIDSLQRRVRELDVLSQVSQAANFSVDFDALLELIIAQTNKLIDAPHFYITLRDTATNELYHAFFLEGDERDRTKENKRWLIGRDLFSDVVRSSQPLRVTHFAAEMAKRGAGIFFENPENRAWMGVPMNAGTGTFGVLAAATSDPDMVFSDEQLQTFRDVAALAATSIDKARLFTETNARARQLQVLNDISRQIVASEAKLEELLQLITASSTEILNAEAGSLLLTPDDGSHDLIFRVAIGGSATGLVGLRIPAGRGLVGEVASKGKPIIVNDVSTDPRWAGELAKGAFQTHNVLAVPLVTQDRVIGVLEVLNKRDGRFSADEVELLTTFAGQAAVAIENARLFQQTDLQLSERVSELETLERIDIELNRSLDLEKVAEITVTWALENSSATAAILGVVVGEPPHLQVVYRTGYTPEDMPEGAEGRLMPLDRGIVSRVMRTRQAELVPDVKYDRDYIPSLRGALSQITLPMLSGGVVNALLVMETNQEPRLRLADMAFLTRLTEHASIAITNAQLYAEITRANQSKSEFVSFVAHELKNPLAVIRGYSDTLLSPMMAAAMSTEQRTGFISKIRGAADRLNTLVGDLNDVTKLQTGNMRIEQVPIDFTQVVDETVRPFEKQIQDKEQRLVVSLPPDMPRVNGDKSRLIQVLVNLVSNAHKYSPEGGEITVAAFVDTTLRDNKGRALPPMLHVYVKDTGIGLSPEDLNRLFTPYFRSDNPEAQAQPGTGLGLTITNGLIRGHGGIIWVESELGVGTTFHFTLPIVEEPVGK